MRRLWLATTWIGLDWIAEITLLQYNQMTCMITTRVTEEPTGPPLNTILNFIAIAHISVISELISFVCGLID